MSERGARRCGELAAVRQRVGKRVPKLKAKTLQECKLDLGWLRWWVAGQWRAVGARRQAVLGDCSGLANGCPN